MEKYRFKQLLESTMGNVKPLIVEDDIKEKSKRENQRSRTTCPVEQRGFVYIVTDTSPV